MITTSGYDPLLLNHYLWWKVMCYEASGEGFQRLFEKVIQRIDAQFMAIRPYGNIGDRKSDGLYFDEGASTVFQVYSPDELTQAEMVAKIKKDLAGAVTNWKGKGLKRWVFVYNVRHGVAPDIAGALAELQKKYRGLTLEHWSSDLLWEKVRGLSVQQRTEILGVPAGYEHFFFAQSDGDSETRELLARGRFVLVHDILTVIDLHRAAEALHPDVALGPPIVIRPQLAPGLWQEAAEVQRLIIDDAIAKSATLRPRFAVFSLSPIPLVIHLGFLLSDRVEVLPFQYDRDRNEWSWDAALAAEADCDIRVRGVPDERLNGMCDVVVRVSLSAPIDPEDTRAAVTRAAAEIDIDVAQPHVMWFRSREQLAVLAQRVRDVLHLVSAKAPGCTRVHLFYSGPTPGALVIGQAINPRMMPEVALYQYSRQASPRYEHALTLTVKGAAPAQPTVEGT
jgi:hypothetical protein